MNLYVKTGKFGCECDYLTEGKVYEVKSVNITCDGVHIVTDGGYLAFVRMDGEVSSHTCSVWYFCDEQGNRLEDN